LELMLEQLVLLLVLMSESTNRASNLKNKNVTI